MIYILLLTLLIFAIYVIKKSPIEIHSQDGKSFPFFQFSSQEFYKIVEDEIKRHEMPNIEITRVNHYHGGIVSSKREYLRISRNEYIFDICAAPFGKDFFVSWWMGESVRSITARIPVLNTILGKNVKKKTFYQLDTEAMFRESVKHAFNDAITIVTTQKGLRGYSPGNVEISPEVK